MKKAELLAMLALVPDGADIQVEDSNLYDTYDIAGVVPASSYCGWSNTATRDFAVQEGVYVVTLD